MIHYKWVKTKDLNNKPPHNKREVKVMKKNAMFQGKNAYAVAIMWTSKEDRTFKYLSMMEVKANNEEIAVKKYITWATKKKNFGHNMYVEYPQYDVKVIKK